MSGEVGRESTPDHHGRYHPVNTNRTRGKKRRLSSRRVTAVIVCLSVACLLLTILVVIFATRSRNNDCSITGDSSDERTKVCVSASCVDVAATYLSNMDRSVDPCTDFFNYTCNGFVKRNPLQGSDLIKDLGINSLAMATDLKLIQILKGRARTLYGKPSMSVRKVKALFSTCLNITANQQNDATRLQQYIDRLGGWTLSGGSANSETPDPEKVAALVHRTTTAAFFAPWIIPNPQLGNIYQIRLHAPDATMPSAAMYKPGSHSRDSMRTYIISVVSMLRNDTVPKDVSQQIENIIDIERAILEVTPTITHSKYNIKNNNEFTLKDMQQVVGEKFQIARYISLLLQRPVDDNYVILVQSPEYMTNLRQIFKNYTKTALVNYLIWQWVHGYIIYSASPFVDVWTKFTLRPVKYEDASCLQMTKKFLNQALGALYLQDHYNIKATYTRPQEKRSYQVKVTILEGSYQFQHSGAIGCATTWRSLKPNMIISHEINDMIRRLKQVFKDNIDSIEWMTHTSKARTREKIDSVAQVVAHFDLHTSAAKLDSHYQYSGEVISGDFLGSIMNLKRNSYAHQISLLGQTQTIINAVSELQAPYDTGASYAPYQNTILVWAGIMQYAFYDAKLPPAAVFGSLGFVVGHEVIHAFDNNGKDYDKGGNYGHWWDNITLTNFEKKARCFIEQYDQYNATSRAKINGTHTLGENMADNGAVKIAYAAMQRWLKTSGEDEQYTKLPGLNMTAQQLFFLALATPLCTVEADILSSYNVDNSPHSQARYRVIGSLRNFDKFSEAFNCPLGSKMNPPKKCSVW